MNPDEEVELLGILVKEFVDVVALNHYYAALLRPLLAGEPTRWRDLSEMERDAYTGLALKQAQQVLAKHGWGMDITMLKETATA